MSILILHASRDGQTAAIAGRIARVLAASGHRVELLPADDPSLAADLAESDVVVFGAGVRYGRYDRAFERAIGGHLPAVAVRPNAFFSVCLAAVGPRAHPEEARRYVDRMVQRTGWKPDRMAIFGGALRYSRYNPLVRLMMRLIARATGKSTDTTRDHEYTDWAAVDRFAAEIAALEDHVRDTAAERSLQAA